MKILFSVYKEDRDTSNIEFIEAIFVQTDWTMPMIDEHLALYDGFRSEIAIGEQFSVFDYYCFFNNYNELVAKIKSIPSECNDTKPIRMPSIFRIRQTDPGSADCPKYPNDKHQFLFSLERFECGASGFEAITLWAASHPLEMVFIGGLVYDFIKWFASKIMCFLGFKKCSTDMRPVVLNTKRLYHNFARLTHLKVSDCQITKINRRGVGEFHVKISTVTGRRFKLNCHANGKIDSFEEV